MKRNKPINVVKGKQGFQFMRKKVEPKQRKVLPINATPQTVKGNNSVNKIPGDQKEIRVRILEKFKKYEEVCKGVTLLNRDGEEHLNIYDFLPAPDERIYVTKNVTYIAENISKKGIHTATLFIDDIEPGGASFLLSYAPDIAKKYKVFVDEKLENFYWANEEGLLHREEKPAHIFLDNDRTIGILVWKNKGKDHNLNGYATVHFNAEGTTEKKWWSAYGAMSHHTSCEKIFRQSLTNEEWYNLCSEGDDVVRALANAHPDCPPQWKIMMQMLPSNGSF